MPSGTKLAMSRRAQELAYVTRHLRDMQGMTMAPFVLVLMAWALWMRGAGLSKHQLWPLAAGIVCSIPAGIVMHRWYKKQFGCVKAPDRHQEWQLSISIINPAPARPQSVEETALLPIYLLVMLGYIMTASLDFHASAFVLVGSSAFLLLPRCFYHTPRIAALQIRRALSIAALVFVGGMVIRAAWMHASKSLIPLGMCVCFLLLVTYDHWLLMYLLGGRRGTEAFDAE